MTAFRIRRSSVAISLTLGLLLATVVGIDGAAAHHPEVGYEYQDESWRGAGAASSPAEEPAEGVERYFLRRDDCGSGADNLHMSFTAGDPDGGDGCGYIPPGWNALNEGFAALGDEEGLVHDYPAAEGLPFTLDGFTGITGRVVIQSYRGSADNPGGLGAGISQAHFTLTGRTKDGTRTLGQTIEEYVVTPDQQRYEVEFEMPAPTELDGIELGSVNFRIRLDGPAANHGYIALSGSSFVDVPGTPGDDDQEPREVPDERLSDVPCENGRADVFDCDGVDLLSFVPASEIESEGISDIWGWTDPDSEDEYVMMGKTNGTAFFRVTDPLNPVYLGALPNPGLTHLQWHDIKVYDNHAFIVSESDAHGMLVFDLTRLRGVEEEREWDADAHYDSLNWAAHNIAINEDSGFAYIVGGNAAIVAPDQCLSGLHMVNISDPTNPTFAGCYALEGGPGTAARFVGGAVEEVSPAAYVHDAQCVNYDGPDEDHQGREICLMASENKVVIADVTNKAIPTTLGVTAYEDVTYAHQGWFSDDKKYWFVNDELDEADGLVDNTRTIVLDVSDLDNPKVHFEYLHDTVSPDHNNYVHEGLLYQSNYSSGLRVLDTAGVADGSLKEIAFFDTFPHAEDTFDGTWSNYPFFGSGTIAVSGRGEGLFLLQVQDHLLVNPAVEVTCADCPVEIRAGETGTATMTISNVGDIDDTYDLAIDGLPEGWTATPQADEVALAVGEDGQVPVHIEVPRQQRRGTYTFTVTATSSVDPQVSASEVVEVEVRKGRPSDAGRPDSTGPSGDGDRAVERPVAEADVRMEQAASASGHPATPTAVLVLGLVLLATVTTRRRSTR